MATTITRIKSVRPSILWVKVPPRRTSQKEANIKAFKEAVKYA